MIDSKRELCITESPIEALSLYQAGIQTVASFSAHHVPYSFFQEHRDCDKQIFIALNSDEAGISGTLKNLRTLTDLGFSNVTMAQPPPGLDWNDLLVAGAFDEKNREQTFEESIWRGDLLLSGSAKEYWQIYRKRYPKLKTHIFS